MATTVTSPTHSETQCQLSCCSPCLLRPRRATHSMWCALIFHGQVQSTFCPWEIEGKPPQGQLHPSGFFTKDPQTLPRGTGPTHPSRRGFFFLLFAAFTAHLHDSKCFLHTVLSLQENQRLVSQHRTLYTVLQNLHHRTQPKSTSYIIGHSLYSLNLHHLATLAITVCTRTRKLPWLAINKPTFSTRVCQGHYSLYLS